MQVMSPMKLCHEGILNTQPINCIATDRALFSPKKWKKVPYLSYFSMKTYVKCTH